MEEKINIRRAQPEDSAPIAYLLRRSIAELCVEDHQNDPEILQRWAGSKTPEMIKEWINSQDSTMFVAIEDDKIIAVGALEHDGGISLNYVHPEARFLGASRLLMQALEHQACIQGHTHCSLHSTGTAKQFYQSLGYTEITSTRSPFGTTVYTMTKNLGG